MIRTLRQGSKQKVCQWTVLPKFESFDWDLQEENERVVTDKTEFENRVEQSNKNKFWSICSIRFLMQSSKLKFLSSKVPLKVKKVSMDASMIEIKPVFTDNNNFDYNETPNVWAVFRFNRIRKQDQTQVFPHWNHLLQV